MMPNFKTYAERCAAFGKVRMPPFIWSKAGVYCISCEADGKQYIGLSKNIMRRLASHFSRLRSGRHSNKHLQSAWTKYGDSSRVGAANSHWSKYSLEQRRARALKAWETRKAKMEKQA